LNKTHSIISAVTKVFIFQLVWDHGLFKMSACQILVCSNWLIWQ